MFVELKTVYNEIEAQVLVSLLKDRNIESIIDKDDAGGMHPHLQATLGVKILVLENDLESAKKIIERNLNNNSKPWVCKKCNEEHEAQFSICWNCGESRI